MKVISEKLGRTTGVNVNGGDIKIIGRSCQFALRIIKAARQLPTTQEARILGNQLLRSGTSFGANIEEAIGTHSKPEFTHKMGIALKAARETHYWLRLLRDSETIKPVQISAIITEAEEIKKFLGAIVRTARRKNE